ncbi:MAG: tetratricopeptide repeat protein [Bacteroidota bacterium]
MTHLTKLFVLIFMMGIIHSQSIGGVSQSDQLADSIIQKLSDADPDEMSSLYNHLALSLLNNEPYRSIGYVDTAIYLAGMHNQDEEIANGFKIKGKAYYFMGLNDSAFTCIKRAEETYIAANNTDSLASLYHFVGSMLSNNNDYRAALKFHFRELEMQTSRKDSAGMSGAMNRIALVFDDWGKYDSAMIFYNKTLKIAETVGNRSRTADVQNNLGNIYLAWGNYEKALDYYISSLAIFEEISDSSGISKSYNNIGIIYYDWHEWDKSLVYYKKSFMVDSLLGNKIGQSQTLNNIAILYDELGQKDKALRVYTRSLEMAVELNDNYQIAISASNIGGLYLEAGDFNKAEDYYTQTLNEYQKANSIMGMAEADILLADLYMKKGAYSKAMQYYRTGLNKVTEMNLASVVMEAYKGMAEVSILMGDYKNAYFFHNEFHKVSDSLFNVETSSQLALLTNAYEIQKKDQEVELQKVRLSEQNSRIKKQRISLIALSATIILGLIFSFLFFRQYRLRIKAWNQLMLQHEEILKNRQELILSKEKAEESDRLKSAFLVNISHELRTPMNGIMGFTDLLQKKNISTEQQQTYLSYIASSGQQLLKVLNDIIDISAIETGQLELEHEACNVYGTLEDCHQFFENYKTEINKESIDIILEEVSEEQKVLIMCDQRRLSQIMHNLIENALAFTHTGSITIGYSIVDKCIIRIYVKDTGIGIERSKFEVIFDRFRQVDESTTRQHGGSGLGLAITKELLSMMKGKIYLESELGTGSTFFIELPYMPVD